MRKEKSVTSNGGARSADAVVTLHKHIDMSVEEREERLIRFRRRLHAEPEQFGEEKQTTSLIAQTLRDAGIEPRVMRNDTGIIADIDIGADSGSFIALRADIDCVPVPDEKSTPYSSTHAGLCHACGHDAHTTMLLGTGLILHELRTEIRRQHPRNNIRLIFQPSEETATGARSMIDQGAIDNVNAILAMHVDPHIKAGKVGLRNGYLTASCKRFRAHIRGKGGHSARPNEAVDPVPALITLVNQFYTLCPRSVDSRDPMVITVASINAGTAFNVIPDEASIAGTLRAISPDASNQAQTRMDAIARGVEESTGCNIDMEYDSYCPPTENDPVLIGYFESAARDALGEDSTQWIARPSMGGEDFAFYQELIPGAMIRLGAALQSGLECSLHSSHFDIDESALGFGVKTLARTAIQAACEFTIKRA